MLVGVWRDETGNETAKGTAWAGLASDGACTITLVVPVSLRALDPAHSSQGHSLCPVPIACACLIVFVPGPGLLGWGAFLVSVEVECSRVQRLG